jgi:hypothetical protein
VEAHLPAQSKLLDFAMAAVAGDAEPVITSDAYKSGKEVLNVKISLVFGLI